MRHCPAVLNRSRHKLRVRQTHQHNALRVRLLAEGLCTPVVALSTRVHQAERGLDTEKVAVSVAIVCVLVGVGVACKQSVQPHNK